MEWDSMGYFIITTFKNKQIIVKDYYKNKQIILKDYYKTKQIIVKDYYKLL